jgi:hypothetical protein
MTPGIEQSKPVTVPGVPKNYPDVKKLVKEILDKQIARELA